MTTLLCRIFILTLCFIPVSIAGENLDDLKNQKFKLENSKQEMLGKGLGNSHPRLIAVEKTLAQLEEQIANAQENLQEVIIMLDGTKSHFMAGHPRHGKTEKAISELLLDGWKIHKIIATGTKEQKVEDKPKAASHAAYVWLRLEE